MKADYPDYIHTRQSLLSRIKDWGDERSWRDFFETYWRLIYNVAVKAGLSETEAEDVLQETVMEVAGKIGDFKYNPQRGRFKGWLLQITRWRIADQFRRRQRARGRIQEASPMLTDLVEAIPDPAAEARFTEIWDEEWQNNLLETAMDRVRQRVAPRTFQMFELSNVKQWPTEQVVRALGVSRAQLYLAKHRVAAALKAEIKTLKETME